MGRLETIIANSECVIAGTPNCQIAGADTAVIDVLNSFDDIPKQSWDKLVEECPDGTVFQSYSWLASWWREFGADGQLQILVCQEGDRLIGAAAMYQSMDNDDSTLRFVGREHSDYNVVLWLKDRPNLVSDLLVFMTERLHVNCINLEEVPTWSATASALMTLSPSFIPREWVTSCPRFRNVDNNLHQLLSKKSVKRKQSKIRQLGNLSTIHLTSADDIAPFLNVLFEQHLKRWEDTAYPSLFREAANRRFYEGLGRTLASDGRVVMTVVKKDDVILAVHFGMRSGDDLLWYKPTYNIDYESYSPGEYLLVELLRYVEQEQLNALDFTRGDEPFKQRFCTEVRTNRDFVWYRNAFRRFATRHRDKVVSVLKRWLRSDG